MPNYEENTILEVEAIQIIEIEPIVVSNSQEFLFSNDFFELKDLVKINKSNNVENFIFKDNIYVFHLINDNTYVYTECRGKAIRGADMRIIKKIKDNIVDNTENDYIFSYNYENYDKIHFNSFNYMEDCNIYASVESIIR
jgi:hypothetical protein